MSDPLHGEFTFYRIIAGKRERADDFRSPSDVGRPRPPAFDVFEGTQADPYESRFYVGHRGPSSAAG